MYNADAQGTQDAVDNGRVEDDDTWPGEGAHKLQEEGDDEEGVHAGGVQEGNGEDQGHQLQQGGCEYGGDDGAVADEVEEILDAKNGVALALLVVQTDDGSDYKETEDGGQLK